ncbi:GNAT family N-acetyltransferase [Burkholderia cenocepacia]|uniref:GNAT family N-acetyltransferase n=1 Tax=Burkholderia cenocepacia TaxID=95486 RepID=UPI0021AB516D|nr:GNAT family N-acetyltransferase [Burkholderia cenocepacia]
MTHLLTNRLSLRQANTFDATSILTYHLKNRDHLQPWEPLRVSDFYTLATQKQRLDIMSQQMQFGNALYLIIRCRESDRMLGECNFSNIVLGSFRACHLGYSISASHQGQGLMYEALNHAIPYVFEAYKLHRIMANYRPENIRSAKLLSRLGFDIEGRARAYLKINGKWTDHMLTSKINDKI